MAVLSLELDGPDSFTISDENRQLRYDLDPGTSTDESLLGVIDFGAAGIGGETFIEGRQIASFAFLTSPFLPGTAPPAFSPFSISAPGEYSFVLRASVNGGMSEASKNIKVSPVPLPASGWMLLVGVGSIATMKRRKKARHPAHRTS